MGEARRETAEKEEQQEMTVVSNEDQGAEDQESDAPSESRENSGSEEGHDRTMTEKPPKKPPKFSVEKRLLSTKEAAHYLGCSEWKVRDLVHKGELHPIQDEENGRWRFDKHELDRYIERNKKLIA